MKTQSKGGAGGKTPIFQISRNNHSDNLDEDSADFLERQSNEFN